LAAWTAKTADITALCLGQLWGRGYLDQFLVATLNGAIPLEQVDSVAMGVAQHLQLRYGAD